MSDYHLHLHPHRPVPGAPPMGVYPDGWIDRYMEAAAARGVTELGFTEHLYRCRESIPVLGRWWERDPDARLRADLAAWIGTERNLSLARYVEVVLDAKARGLPVKLGLEVDFVPGTEVAVLDLLAGIPFDYLVGSIHWIGAWNFMRDSARAEYERRGTERAFAQYFELEAALAGSGLVDVLAHADVIARHALQPGGDLGHLYGPVVAAAARSGTAIEVSSAGLRHRVQRLYPAPSFLARFRAAGVPITLASDAHVADDAALGYEVVVAAARRAGYTEYLRFEARRRVPTPLPALPTS
ncbi:MAG: PHP domain-containing protein [Chloroflexota bacterium]